MRDTGRRMAPTLQGAGHRLWHHCGTRGSKTSPITIRRRARRTAVLALPTRFTQVGRVPVAMPLQRLSAAGLEGGSDSALAPRRALDRARRNPGSAPVAHSPGVAASDLVVLLGWGD